MLESNPLYQQLSAATAPLIGFGFMNASWPGSKILENAEERANFIGALHFAMDAGVRLFDTADIYAPSFDSMGHNEALLGEAVASWHGTDAQKAQLVLATKGGITRAQGEAWGKDSSFDYLMRAVEASAAKLQVSEIPLWQQHRLDTHQTLKDQLRVLARFKKSAPIRWLGVSNYSAEQLEAAVGELGGPTDGGLVSVQNQLNPAYRQQLDVLEVCEKHGIVYLPWSPMKGVRIVDAGTDVHRFFTSALSISNGADLYALAQAWLRSLSPNIVPIPGVTRLESLKSSLAGANYRLTAQEAEALAALPASEELDEELVRDQPLNQFKFQ